MKFRQRFCVYFEVILAKFLILQGCITESHCFTESHCAKICGPKGNCLNSRPAIPNSASNNLQKKLARRGKQGDAGPLGHTGLRLFMDSRGVPQHPECETQCSTGRRQTVTGCETSSDLERVTTGNGNEHWPTKVMGTGYAPQNLAR